MSPPSATAHLSPLAFLSHYIANLEFVTSAVPILMAYVGSDYRYRFTNRTYQDWFDRPAHTITSHTVAEVVGDRLYPFLKPHIEEALAGNAVEFERWFDFPTGRRYIHAYYLPDFDVEGKVQGIAILGEDLSRRRVAEEALRASEQQFHAIFDLAPIGIAQTSLDGRYLVVNQRLAAITGYSRYELTSGTSYLDITHPDDRARNGALLQQLLAAEIPSYSLEKRYIRKDGTVVWARNSVALVYDREGAAIGTIGIVEDMNEQILAAQRLADSERQLRQSNADLTHFAYAVSHDLREPLRTMSACSQLLSLKHGALLDENARQLLNYISDGAARMDALLRDLLVYTQASQQSGPPPRADAGTILQEVVRSLSASIVESQAEVISTTLPSVGAHPIHLTQIFQNLLANALRYRNPSAPPRIHIASVFAEGHHQFQVADNGIGIDPDKSDYVFGMFKRLHSRELSGSGLGLALCKRIVESYSGRIWVESVPGQGSTFYFTLPPAPAPDELAG
jgi:PAS domain S-box-containing protein